MINIFDKTKLPMLEKALDTYSLRQKAISANIANISTPGYKRIEVKFEENLTDALKEPVLKPVVTNEKHIQPVKKDIKDVEPEVIESPAKTGEDKLASGFNDVDIDQENVLMAQNQLQYRMASRLVGRIFKSLQSAITGTSQ